MSLMNTNQIQNVSMPKRNTLNIKILVASISYQSEFSEYDYIPHMCTHVRSHTRAYAGTADGGWVI